MELPVSLNLRDWFAFSLADSNESVRLVALEEFTATGLPAEFAEQVARLAAEDLSSVCRERAAALLELDAKKGEAENLAAGFEATPQSMRELFEQAPTSLRKALLRAVWKPPSPALLDLWRDQLLSEQVPEIIAIGLSLLCRSGNIGDVGLGLTFLAAESAAVVTAAIDLLFIRDRQALIARLPGLLRHANLDIRFHAIRRLGGIDQREALHFLNAAIDGDDPMVRRRSIQELSLLTAKDAEPSFVRVLGLETQPLLLVMAGRALAAKPTLEMPPFIYDTYLVSKGVKKHILNLILRLVVQSIRESGALDEPIDTYLGRLHLELEGRRADLAVSLAMRDLRHQDPDVRKQVLEKLPPLLSDPRIQKALRARLKIESDAELKARVAALLEEAGGSEVLVPAEMVPATASPGKPPISSPMDSLALITSKERFAEARESLVRLLESSAERPVLVRVLKLFQAFGSAADAPLLMPLLKRKDADPSIVSNALKAIAHLDFDAVANVINPLLRDENLGIKAAALEVYVTCDKEGALQYLKSMIVSPLASVRRKALSIVPLLDGPSIEPLLLNMLQTDSQADLQAQAGFLLASNPNESAVKALFRHTHPVGKSPDREMNELWETVRPAVATFSGQSMDAIDAWLETKVRQEDAARPAIDARYAFDAVQGLGGTCGSGSGSPEEGAGLTFDTCVALCGVFSAFFFVMLFLEYLGPESLRDYRKAEFPERAVTKAPPGNVDQAGRGSGTTLTASPTRNGARPRDAGWTTLPGSWMPRPVSK